MAPARSCIRDWYIAASWLGPRASGRDRDHLQPHIRHRRWAAARFFDPGEHEDWRCSGALSFPVEFTDAEPDRLGRFCVEWKPRLRTSPERGTGSRIRQLRTKALVRPVLQLCQLHQLRWTETT